MNTMYRPQIPAHMMVTFDGRVVVTPRLRNGLVDGDAARTLLRCSGPTALDLARTAEGLAAWRAARVAK